MADDEVQYEHQSVKVIRGREASKIAELQKQRWELVSQTQGRLRTEMTFRRVKKRLSYAPWMGGVALAAVIILVLAFYSLGDDDSEPEPPPAAASTATDEPTEEPTEQPTEEPTEEPTEQPTEEPTEEPTEKPTESPSEEASEPTEEPTESETPAPPVNGVLTTDNNADLKAMLEADDNYDLNLAFSKDYKGREIAFNGSVADAAPGYYLVYFGDNSDTNVTSGPAFQFRVRNLPVSTGDNIRVIAEVGAFNADQGLFYLTPVKVTSR